MWVISKDGTGLTKLTDQFVYLEAQWSPTGTQIAYLLDGPDLWVMNADGTDPTLVATDAWRISWAPDGSLIAFAGQGLETVRPDGSDRRQVVDMIIDPDNGYPYWSPGASTIAFVSYPNEVLGEPRDVYTVSPDGTGLTNITSHPAADEIGSWGP
jgi:Tol biopolymer transport system component